MNDIKLETIDNRIYVTSPYDRQFVAGAHNLGGHWDSERRAWAFDPRDDARVKSLLSKIYGWSDTSKDSGKKITIRVHVADHTRDWQGDESEPLEYGNDGSDMSEIRMRGRRIAWRPGRDSQVRLADNVVLVSGDFGERGGSRNQPRVLGSYDDPVVEIRDIDPSMLEGIDPKAYEVVDGSEREALEERKKALLAEIAEIDKQLAALD